MAARTAKQQQKTARRKLTRQTLAASLLAPRCDSKDSNTLPTPLHTDCREGHPVYTRLATTRHESLHFIISNMTPCHFDSLFACDTPACRLLRNKLSPIAGPQNTADGITPLHGNISNRMLLLPQGMNRITVIRRHNPALHYCSASVVGCSRRFLDVRITRSEARRGPPRAARCRSEANVLFKLCFFYYPGESSGGAAPLFRLTSRLSNGIRTAICSTKH